MCVKIKGSIKRPDLFHRCFPMVTLIDALGHLSMRKLHTKSQISLFEKFLYSAAQFLHKSG